MALTWSSIGHVFASGFKDVVTGAKAVEAFIAKIDTPANQTEIEALTALIPGIGTQAAAAERLAFAALGEFAAAVNSADAAAQQNGLNVTLDAAFVAEIKALMAEFPALVAQAVAAFAKK